MANTMLQYEEKKKTPNEEQNADYKKEDLPIIGNKMLLMRKKEAAYDEDRDQDDDDCDSVYDDYDVNDDLDDQDVNLCSC